MSNAPLVRSLLRKATAPGWKIWVNRDAARAQLMDMGRDAVPTLVDAAVSARGRQKLKDAIADILSQMDNSAMMAMVSYLEATPSVFHVEYLARVLGKAGHKDAVPVLVKWLSKLRRPVGFPEMLTKLVRHTIAESLNGFGAEASPWLPALKHAADQEQEEVVKRALQGAVRDIEAAVERSEA